jgi:hypothetical protein
MRDKDRPDPPPSERVHDIERALKEMRLAVREALLRHKKLGNPIAVWRNNRVEWIQPEDIPAD